jgi:MYXO-CTERM domain-containing protein
MRFRLTCLAGLGLLATTFACSTTEEETDGSEAAHTRGEIVWNNDPHSWADVEADDFASRTPGKEIAPEDHLTTARIQVWIDRYDAIVRAMVQESGTELVAPKPKARIVLAADNSASVATVPGCIATAANPPDPLPGDAFDLTMMQGPRATFSTGGAGLKCLETKNWTPASGLGWFNALGGFKVSNGDQLVEVKSGDELKARAVHVGIMSAAPFVDVNAGLIGNVGEKTVAVVLAHELAHYYRAHKSTSVHGKYDFWYDRDAHAAERPTPVADQGEYGRQYQALKLPRHLVPGQKFHPRATSTLLTWMSEMKVAAGHPCSEALDAFAGLAPKVQGNLKETTDIIPLDSKGRAALLALEPSIQTCIAGVELTEDPAPATTTTFDSNKIPRAWFMNRVADALLPEILVRDLNTTAKLEDLVKLLETAGRSLDEKAPEFLKRLAKNHIGFYTDEQEADELSMELASRVGIRPGDVMDAWTRMAYAVEKENPQLYLQRQGMTAKECADLAKTNFQSGADEEKVYVSLGSLDDPHHAWCYRLLNLQREREAHSYRSRAPSFEPEATPWKDVQDAAKALIAVPEPEPEPKPAPPTSEPDAGATGPASTDSESYPEGSESGDDYAGDDYAGDDYASDDPVPTAKKKKTAEGCSTTAAGTGSGSWAWMIGIAAALVLTRRRRS